MASERRSPLSRVLAALAAIGSILCVLTYSSLESVSFATSPVKAAQGLRLQSIGSVGTRSVGVSTTQQPHQALFRRATARGLIARQALQVDLTGKVAFIAGIADTSGYGWAIARELANAGATIVIGTWPPVLKIFERTLKKLDNEEAAKLDDGSVMQIAKVYPLDAVYDTMDSVPEDVKTNKRYAGVGDFTIQEVADKVSKDFGKVDILVHSLANGPEVTKPLLETSRAGYLAASSASAYSLVSLVQHFGPMMQEGGSVLSLTYIASERVIPGYGGGMSSAKAQLESDTRTLAFEAGRKWGVRVNTISAGPLKSRAASAIGNDGKKTFIERAIDYSMTNSPLGKPLYSKDVGTAALGLHLMSSVTGVTLYVDNGLHAMGQTLDSPAFEGL